MKFLSILFSFLAVASVVSSAGIPGQGSTLYKAQLGTYEAAINFGENWIASELTTRASSYFPNPNPPYGGLQTPLVDQTVWFIQPSSSPSAQDDGYFQANVIGMFEYPQTAYSTFIEAAQASGASDPIIIPDFTGSTFLSISCMRTQGSITPEGAVYMSFIPVGGSTATITTGLGRFYQITGQPVGNNNGNGNGKGNGNGNGKNDNGGPGKWQFLMQMGAGGSFTTQHWSYMVACRENEPCYSNLPGSNLSIPDAQSYCTEAWGTTVDL